jgi:hypothetical protein
MPEAQPPTEAGESETYRKAIEYSRARYRLYFATTAYGLTIRGRPPLMRSAVSRRSTSRIRRRRRSFDSGSTATRRSPSGSRSPSSSQGAGNAAWTAFRR